MRLQTSLDFTLMALVSEPPEGGLDLVTNRKGAIGFIDFCEKSKYLGSILRYSLTSDADVDKRIASATAAFGALKTIFNSKDLSKELKGEVYKAHVLPTLLYGCEACPRPGATQGSRQRRSGGFWLGAPKRRSNDGLSSMQKQTLKRSKSGSKFIHEQFPL